MLSAWTRKTGLTRLPSKRNWSRYSNGSDVFQVLAEWLGNPWTFSALLVAVGAIIALIIIGFDDGNPPLA